MKRTSQQDSTTLIEVLERHLARHADRVQVTVGDSGRTDTLTYAELHQRGLSVASALQEQGIGAGETVALMLPTSTAYFSAFLGVILDRAGAPPHAQCTPHMKSLQRYLLCSDSDFRGFVVVKGNAALQSCMLVVGRLVAPDGVLQLLVICSHAEVPRRSLEGAFSCRLGGFERLHVHVGAREIISGGVSVFIDPDDIARVRHDLAGHAHLNPPAHGYFADPVLRPLTMSG